ncbi:MAG: riboflavin synthase [Candidatus Azotimanducaceae bacterium]|jgi:riboflavin synthase
MYTGIVQALLPIDTIERKSGLSTFSIRFPEPLKQGLELGGSVAVNGCCFTVTTISDSLVTFDAIKETLAITNIKLLDQGSLVNIERSARPDDEIGGHILSGHIIDTAEVVTSEETENNQRLTFRGDSQWMRYVFNKGFLAVNGCSLTVAAIDYEKSEFSINLIPETLARTNFALLGQGDLVNIEIDHQTQVIVDTVERVMQERYKA